MKGDIVITNIGYRARIVRNIPMGYLVCDTRTGKQYKIRYNQVKTKHCYKTGQNYTWDFQKVLMYMNTGSKYDTDLDREL